jgi:hypothetical protein
MKAVFAALAIALALVAPATELLAQTTDGPVHEDKTWDEQDPLGEPTGNVVERVSDVSKTSTLEIDDWTETTNRKDDPTKKPLKIVRHIHHTSLQTPKPFEAAKETSDFLLNSIRVVNQDGSVTVDGTTSEFGTIDRSIISSSPDDGDDESPQVDLENGHVSRTFHELWLPSSSGDLKVKLESDTYDILFNDGRKSTFSTEHNYGEDEPEVTPAPPHTFRLWSFGIPVLGLAAVIVPLELGAPAAAATHHAASPGTTTPCSATPCTSSGSVHRRTPFAIRFRL